MHLNRNFSCSYMSIFADSALINRVPIVYLRKLFQRWLIFISVDVADYMLLMLPVGVVG